MIILDNFSDEWIVSAHSNTQATNALYITVSVCMHNSCIHHEPCTHILVCSCLKLCTSTSEKRNDLSMALLYCHVKRGHLYIKTIKEIHTIHGKTVYMLSMKEDKDAKTTITTLLRLCNYVPCRFMRGLHDIGCSARP